MLRDRVLVVSVALLCGPCAFLLGQDSTLVAPSTVNRRPPFKLSPELRSEVSELRSVRNELRSAEAAYKERLLAIRAGRLSGRDSSDEVLVEVQLLRGNIRDMRVHSAELETALCSAMFPDDGDALKQLQEKLAAEPDKAKRDLLIANHRTAQAVLRIDEVAALDSLLNP